MADKTIHFRACTQEKDRSGMIDFLNLHRKDLRISSLEVVEQVIDRCFTQGGIMAGYDQHGNPHAMIGYFRGDPFEAFANKEMAFIYIALLSPSYRLSRTFYYGLHYTLRELEALGFESIRLQAGASDPYTNKLYSRFVPQIGQGKNLRGMPVNTYGGPLKLALHYFKPANVHRGVKARTATAINGNHP